MSKDKQILSIGGGGFGRNTGNLLIEKYIVSLSDKKKPNICFLPTATGDNDLYKVNFYSVFTKLNCNPTHIDLFKRSINLKKHIMKQDIIYVGGGNTKSMLGVWKEWGLDLVLEEAYNSGIILSGVSAGAICWFEKGITDSFLDHLSILDCLGFVEGICCPHFDEEIERIPYVENQLLQQNIKSCVAIEGNCALHFVNGKPYKSINFGNNKKSYYISVTSGEIIRNEYEVLDLNL